ncbi:MAG TPA: helix-turn-helix domain-containing protein [Candidatus Hydrogenedentes bacterium]|nr:helix-turn-helix domain-containing protein [Candidatus Hydrogenedentota bacterium]HQE83037.1 helix-turn-helix domain-containing protein [Candidatus Hydrogenedentota bacterium]HQH53441.1 helix-turn-helix domain-containing protein [Candidatus Hydrogenedentota bacterium]
MTSETIRAAEAQAILDALARCGGNRNEAAKAFEMHRSTVFRKARSRGISLPRHVAVVH